MTGAPGGTGIGWAQCKRRVGDGQKIWAIGVRPSVFSMTACSLMRREKACKARQKYMSKYLEIRIWQETESGEKPLRTRRCNRQYPLMTTGFGKGFNMMGPEARRRLAGARTFSRVGWCCRAKRHTITSKRQAETQHPRRTNDRYLGICRCRNSPMAIALYAGRTSLRGGTPY